MTALVAALVRRARRDGARPLLTYYDLTTGARTELSGRTFANWVDKTYHLLVDLEVEPGDVVAVPLAATHPGHWVGLAVIAGAWQAGAVVDPSAAPDATVSVVGPESLGAEAAGTVLACSLHPLGFGFADPLPDGVVDFSAEVRMRPDAHAEEPVAESATAWRDAGSVRSHADLAAVPRTSARVLVRPSTPLATLTEAYLAPLLGDGSAVVVVGDDADACTRIAREERVG
ncbi:MAG TPA: TIGR03089 family protein [Propionibacteriaceae bacterium]|nr:TIGR03089 family protein [Propionibacteriaceae bacterium]